MMWSARRRLLSSEKRLRWRTFDVEAIGTENAQLLCHRRLRMCLLQPGCSGVEKKLERVFKNLEGKVGVRSMKIVRGAEAIS